MVTTGIQIIPCRSTDDLATTVVVMMLDRPSLVDAQCVGSHDRCDPTLQVSIKLLNASRIEWHGYSSPPSSSSRRC